MPDVDLSLVMAPGDFLQRIGDELVGSTGPVGPAGPQGPTGPQGPAGDPGDLTQAAADTRYVNVTGDTMTGDLTIAKNIPTINLDATGTNDIGQLRFQDGGINRWLLYRDGVSGNFIFQRRDTAGVAQDNPIIMDQSTGAVTFVNPPIVPAATVAGRASRISAYDATTGRLALDGVESGNTGWRTITSWDTAGVITGAALSASFVPRTGNAGFVRMKRVGAVTWVSCIGLQAAVAMTAGTEYELCAAGALPTVGWAYTPSGFGSVASGGAIQWWASRWGAANGPFRMTPLSAATSGTVLCATETFFTFPAAAAWPATLPGTQHTAPFTG